MIGLAQGEPGFVTPGLLAGARVSMARTETEDEIRVVACRKATCHQARRSFNEAQDGGGTDDERPEQGPGDRWTS